jgi:hypothetical protein
MFHQVQLPKSLSGAIKIAYWFAVMIPGKKYNNITLMSIDH